MEESFIGKMQVKNRVVVPKLIADMLKLENGTKVRVKIERLR